MGIVIGGSEAQAIALELEKMKPVRPLTHDLFKSFADAFDIKIIEVFINKFHDGVFYAVLVCVHGDETIELDSRTSDAVALAVRFQCPIFTTEEVFKAIGMAEDQMENPTSIEEPDESEEEHDELYSEFSMISLEELEKMLEEAIAEEAFERASQIRDEIKRRKKEE
jgi:bifunctional DNase/RNase